MLDHGEPAKSQDRGVVWGLWSMDNGVSHEVSEHTHIAHEASGYEKLAVHGGSMARASLSRLLQTRVPSRHRNDLQPVHMSNREPGRCSGTVGRLCEARACPLVAGRQRRAVSRPRNLRPER